MQIWKLKKQIQFYLMIWCSKKNWENYLENAFEQKKKKPRLKFNHWSVLIGLQIQLRPEELL